MGLPALTPTPNPKLASTTLHIPGGSSSSSSHASAVDWSSTKGLYVAICTLRSHVSSAAQSQPLPWPTHTALQVARALSRRLLRIHPAPRAGTEEEGDDRLFIPTPANPSPVWSPSPALSLAAATTAAGGSWADVHSIYSRIPTRYFTNQDFNLALYAHHHASSPATTLKFISTHFLSSTSRATLSSFPDTSSLAIYHLTLAHRSTPQVHALIHDHMSRSTTASSPTDQLVHATAADRGIHALLLAQAHALSPAPALLATVDAVYPWYARHAPAILDTGAPARVLCTALYLTLLNPPGSRDSVTHLLALLARHNPWPLAAYVCVLKHACGDGADRSLVPMWVAEMDADTRMRRVWRASAQVQGLVFSDGMQRALDAGEAEAEAEDERASEWRRPQWPWRKRQRQRVSTWATMVDAFVADALLTSSVDNWVLVIRLLVRNPDLSDRIERATQVFHMSVAHARPALAAVPQLVHAQCAAGMFADAARVVLTVDGGRAVAGDVERVLAPFARQMCDALHGEEEVRVTGSVWARWVALAVDCDWIGLLRGMGVLAGDVAVPRVLVGDLMVVLGKRGLVEEAGAVVTGVGGNGNNVREWVQAFERGAEAGGFGVRAARAMGGELERVMLVNRS